MKKEKKSKPGKLPKCLRESAKIRHTPRPDISEWLVAGDQMNVAIRFSIQPSRIHRMLAGEQPPVPEVIKELEKIANKNKKQHGQAKWSAVVEGGPDVSPQNIQRDGMDTSPQRAHKKGAH